MRITAPRTQDERLVPLLDTPPKWLPVIDVGIQIHFSFIYFFFLTGIFYWSSYPPVFMFPLKWVCFRSLKFRGCILFYFAFNRGGSDAVVVWFISHATQLQLFGHCDRTGSPCFVPFKASVAHCQGQMRATLFMKL